MGMIASPTSRLDRLLGPQRSADPVRPRANTVACTTDMPEYERSSELGGQLAASAPAAPSETTRHNGTQEKTAPLLARPGTGLSQSQSTTTIGLHRTAPLPLPNSPAADVSTAVALALAHIREAHCARSALATSDEYFDVGSSQPSLLHSMRSSTTASVGGRRALLKLISAEAGDQPEPHALLSVSTSV